MGYLRFYLATSVFVWHFASRWTGTFMFSFTAVFCFFIISGFYMSLILNGPYRTAGLRAFYFNRALRLYPTYLAALLVAAMLRVTIIPLFGPSCDTVLCWIDQVLILPPVIWDHLPAAWQLD